MDELRTVAVEAVEAGGDYLAEQFRTGEVAGEYGTDDVKAVADREAESRVVDVIRRSFPEHAIHGEESGQNGQHRYEWVVDPLDGTNNFASGLPSFATAVAVLDDGDPIVSAIYEPLAADRYLAVAGEGATRNGEPLRADTDRDLRHGTLSFVVGLPAVRDDALRAQATQIGDALGEEAKRVVQTWSPCVDWGLVAAGRLEGIVCFHPDVYEQHAGALLADESGVASVSRDGLYVGSPDPAIRDRLLTVLDESA
ncbi:inositol monophosphatase family protein [Salinirubrum litoreum]|uniref:fructose-bisphosphatase n=1 Tax=Salinirubrum litoreum TaxID=1126234 RepID=A0ABD5R9X1_9EURY|nr:inositol monophosphatase [Salinirubrum litoreum]